MVVRLMLLILSFLVISSCQSDTRNPLQIILDKKNDIISPILNEKDKYEVQIIYTRISRDSTDHPIFNRYAYNLDTTRYFYPASTIKMPVAFLALQRIKELREGGKDIDIDTRIQFDSIRPAQSPMVMDSCSETGYPTIASLIDQVFAISDNNAYNRLYEFLGQDYINKELRNRGIFHNSRIITRVGVSGFDREENTYINPIRFIRKDQVVYELKGRKSKYNVLETNIIKNMVKGMGYVDAEGQLVEEPFDMSEKNFINLADLERSLQRMIFPTNFPLQQRYDIRPDHYRYILQSMAKLPKDFPCYQHNEDYYDGYVKFFLFGDSKAPIPEHIVIRNKVGFAYGYLTDCAYITDTESNIEFFLSATIHVNENQIYNDGVYEYDSIGIPFLAELGRQVYHYELSKNNKDQ